MSVDLHARRHAEQCSHSCALSSLQDLCKITSTAVYDWQAWHPTSHLMPGPCCADAAVPSQVPQAFALAQAPICLEGDVTTGFGRGSASMGTPTANLPPEPLQEQLAGLPLGVYFGCACCGMTDTWQLRDLSLGSGLSATLQACKASV